MGSVRPWGCPKCGTRESLVADTDRDADGYVVRIRKCNNLAGCDGKWETEEVVMNPGSFWGRARPHRLERDRARFNGKLRPTCQWCGGRYTYGSYNMHVRKSDRHAAALKPPANGSDRKTQRDYQRDWKRRKVA